jgi:hypothetical protein
MLPFRFTAQVSLDDAAKLAKALGIPLRGAADRGAVNGFEKDPVRHLRRACRATSPKRICRRAPAARS